MDGFALVGITPFIQGGQKSIEDAIGRLKNFIEKNDVTVRELALRNDCLLYTSYLRYINFNGYDYTRTDGWSFSVSK